MAREAHEGTGAGPRSTIDPYQCHRVLHHTVVHVVRVGRPDRSIVRRIAVDDARLRRIMRSAAGGPSGVGEARRKRDEASRNSESPTSSITTTTPIATSSTTTAGVCCSSRDRTLLHVSYS